MSKPIESHEAINRILEKFGAKVRFLRVTTCNLRVEIAPRSYSIEFFDTYTVREIVDPSLITVAINNYSRWVEGVLNGLVRDDSGDLKHYE